MPLVNCPYMALGGPELKCDLCNGDCTQTLFVLRAYRRQQPAPRHLHHAIMYAGRDCCQVLLRDRQLPPEKVMQRELERLMTETTWESHLAEILGSCESTHEAERLAETIQRLLFGEERRRPAKQSTATAAGTSVMPQSAHSSRPLKQPLAIQALNE